MSTKKGLLILGARGFNNYGGFEKFVAEIAPRLVKKDFDVYCSSETTSNRLSTIQGVRIIYFPIKMPSNYSLRKLFEILYDIYFILLGTFVLKCDYLYILGVGAGIFTLFPRIFKKKSIVNVDGVEWERQKFNIIEKIILKFMFECAVAGANHVIIDSRALVKYVRNKYVINTKYISYGVSEIPMIIWDVNKLVSYIKSIDLSIKPNCYWLVVARLEPENNIHIIIKSYLMSNTEKELVIVGNASTNKYMQILEEVVSANKSINKKIIFMGSIYNTDHINMLRQHCFAYLHGHSVGGTNPSLLEALISKNIVISHNNPFNKEVCGNFALYFKNEEDLKIQIDLIDKNPANYSNNREELFKIAKKYYNWDDIANSYTSLLRGYQ